MIGHPAVHLSSMKGVTEVKALLLCGHGPPTSFLFSDSSTSRLQAESPGEARSFLTLLSHCPSVTDCGTPHASCTSPAGRLPSSAGPRLHRQPLARTAPMSP